MGGGQGRPPGGGGLGVLVCVGEADWGGVHGVLFVAAAPRGCRHAWLLLQPLLRGGGGPSAVVVAGEQQMHVQSVESLRACMHVHMCLLGNTGLTTRALRPTLPHPTHSVYQSVLVLTSCDTLSSVRVALTDDLRHYIHKRIASPMYPDARCLRCCQL